MNFIIKKMFEIKKILLIIYGIYKENHLNHIDFKKFISIKNLVKIFNVSFIFYWEIFGKSKTVVINYLIKGDFNWFLFINLIIYIFYYY